jgi:Raf kinase inhibitor-like YbhB/YbcL family protein
MRERLGYYGAVINSSFRVFEQRSALVVLALSLGSLSVSCSDDSNQSKDVGALQGTGGSTPRGNGMSGAAGNTNAGTSGSAGSTGSAGAGAGGASTAGSGGGSGAGSVSSGGAAGDGSAPGEPDAGNALGFTLTSPAFENNPGCGPEGDAPAACALFDVDNTGLGDGANLSPAIDWTGVPAGTQSFAIAFHDLSNINGQSPFTHWVMWNIPGTSTGLPAGLPAGAEPGVPAEDTQQVSFRDNDAFAGSGQCGNVYEFVLYALSVPQLAPPNTSSADAVQDALEASDAVLDTATMRGRSNPAGPCN